MKLPKWLYTGSAAVEKNGPRYWFRTSMGLEDLAAEEIREVLPVAALFQSHRNVWVTLEPETEAGDTRAVLQIRTADDVYRYLGCCEGIDRTKASVDQLIIYAGQVASKVLSADKGAEYFRCTVSFVGKRNFNRYFVEEKINAALAEQTRLKPLSNQQSDSKIPGELRLRCHLEDQTAFIGLGLQDTPLHRRTWRSIRYTGQLHTPVAAAMVRGLKPKPGSLIIDPFCGSGTILLEAAIQYPQASLQGFDIQQAAIEVARQSAILAGVSLNLQVMDSLDVVKKKQDYYLLSNPPWDEQHQIGKGKLERFINGLGELVQQSTAAVLLLPEELARAVAENTGRPFQLLAKTRIRGKLAVIIKFPASNASSC